MDKNRILVAALLFLAALTNACKKEPAVDSPVQAPHLIPAELAARFPADLGSGTVDVSNYPADLQENYKLFLAVCSACHTPARALNSPIVSEKDWKRFVHRMHVKIQNRGYVLDSGDERKIVEFLVYDSKIRKVDSQEEFQSRQKVLELVYKQVVKERERLIEEETKRMPKKEVPYMGVK